MTKTEIVRNRWTALLVAFLMSLTIASPILGVILERGGHPILGIIIGFLWVFFLGAGMYFLVSLLLMVGILYG